MRVVLSRGLLTFALCLLVAVLLSACGGGGGGDGSNVISQGTLTTTLTDSSTEDYQAVYVTIDRVDVHSLAGGWQTVATPAGTYNLLDLVNGVRETLGVSYLDAGDYTQMRLIIGKTPASGSNILGDPHPYANYLILDDNSDHLLKVPSGYNTGLKIVHGFTINNNEATELILDFDALKSIVSAGKGKKYLLKPTVKVLRTEELANVSGHVSDAGSGLDIGGALVSAQDYVDVAIGTADQVTVASGTISDENGDYALYLQPGDYNLLAYKTGYEPQCTSISLLAEQQLKQDFSLTATTDIGTIAGTVTITTPVDLNQHVTIDFRLSGLCPDLADKVTVKSIMVFYDTADPTSGIYTVNLPAGLYEVVSSTEGEVSQVVDINVVTSSTFAHNITF